MPKSTQVASDENQNIALPKPLEPGDTIGIAAPAGPFDRELFQSGIQIIEKHGFEVFIPEEVYDRKGYLAGSDESRAAVLNRLLNDSKIQAVFCARGGYGSMRILSHIDYPTFRIHPKIIVGFSDITALLVTMFERTGVVTFHGPVVTTLGKGEVQTLTSLFSAVSAEEAFSITPETPHVISEGSAAGRIIGGNLTTLCHLIGTPFEPHFDHRILFLEDVGEAVYRIDRMVVHMKLAGCFERLRGIILGEFERCGRLEEVYQLFGDLLGELRIPILGGFNLGHGQTNLTLPIGRRVELDTQNSVLYVI